MPNPLTFISQHIASLRAERPVLLTLLLFLLLVALVAPVSLDAWDSNPGFRLNLLAEVSGVLLDLLLFGCLLLWLDRKAERYRRVERYENAINDFCGWETEEATYRIVGNIRRLNREGSVPDRLNNAHLANADLKGANLKEAALNGATLSGADLRDADLSGAYLGSADLSKADLFRADLSGAHFGIFPGMDVSEVKNETVLDGAFLRGGDLRDIRNATADTFRNARTLYKARLDPDLRAEIEEQHPELLEPRVSDMRE